MPHRQMQVVLPVEDGMVVALTIVRVIPSHLVVAAVLLISLHGELLALQLGTPLITSIHASSLPVAAVAAEKTPAIPMVVEVV